jgi:hypothetical protein
LEIEVKRLQDERDRFRADLSVTRLERSVALAEVDRLKALCAKAAHHLRTIPIQSDYKDGLMAAELEAEAKP